MTGAQQPPTARIFVIVNGETYEFFDAPTPPPEASDEMSIPDE